MTRSFSRLTKAIGGATVVGILALVSDTVAALLLAAFAVVGIVVAVAFVYDWCLGGYEDLDAERHQQNAAKARFE